MRELSTSAFNRVVRQSRKRIAALTERLTTCPLKVFDEVKGQLFAEQEALAKLLKRERGSRKG